jgi:DNA-directed RNA polymerase subunit RPC12/RpoP
MSRTRHTCSGCHARLERKDDLEKDPGTVYPSWRCRYCGTELPGIVAEKLKHQQ